MTGKADIAVYRSLTGDWLIRRATSPDPSAEWCDNRVPVRVVPSPLDEPLIRARAGHRGYPHTLVARARDACACPHWRFTANGPGGQGSFVTEPVKRVDVNVPEKRGVKPVEV